MGSGWALMGHRVILHLDLDYFFAQCEERDDPALRGKPVVVGVYSDRGGDSGVVSTANYVARKYGVRSGMPLTLAKKRLMNAAAVFLPTRKAVYQEASDNVMRLLHGYADTFEQASIDEAFLDVTQRVTGDFRRGEALANEIRATLRLREGLTCSIGVGPNKLIAKVAAGQRKPDGVMMVTPNEVNAFLSPLPVEELPGIGPKTAKRMLGQGIKTVGDLARYRVEELIRVFGKASGTYFFEASKGIDETPVREGKRVKQVSRITTLREDTRDVKTILLTVHRLCEAVHAAILLRGFCFKSLSVIAVMENFTTRTRSTTLEVPTNALPLMKTCAQRLLEGLLHEDEAAIRRIGVRASQLIEGVQQKPLTTFIK
jgi:DNA polymerase IV (DinB-like DNA polymerase)